MLIKAADDRSKRRKLLEELQKSDRLDDRQKNWLREERHRLGVGMDGERDAAHYLDMSFSGCKNRRRDGGGKKSCDFVPGEQVDLF